MRSVLLLAVLLVGFRDAAAQRFDTADKLLLGASTLAMMADWSTTMDAANRGGRELNPIAAGLIGAYPSRHEVNAYFGASLIGTAFVASRLPPTWRKVWLVAVMASSIRATAGNRSRGLRFTLEF